MYTQTPGYTSTDTLLPYTTLLRSKYSNFYKSIPNQMSQVPFTPEGVQQKLGELYNLSDAQLLAQAQQLNMNLRPWVEENFELNAAQKKYLSKVPEEILRSEEHTSELQSLMRNSYDVFCLNKKK